LLIDEEKTDLGATIRRDYISTHKDYPLKFIMPVVRRLYQDHRATDSANSTDSSDESHSEELRTSQRRRNPFTHKWREGFLHSHSFSLRHSQIRKRLKPSDGILAPFLTDMQIAFEQYSRDRILDTDETPWKNLNDRMVTMVDCGSESVTCEFDGHKGCVTVIASIDGSGHKLPLWVIYRGTTIRCESELRQNFAREIQTHELILTHQENNWNN
jgi:hypothetical protein